MARSPALPKFSVLNDDWTVDEAGRSFTSPPVSAQHPEQLLIFADRLRNGSISCDITPLKAGRSPRETLSLEAALVFRYTGPEGSYYAGTSAFDTKFFLAKVMPGPFFQLRQYVGRRSSVIEGKTYRLKVEFKGSQITLYENDVQQLSLVDDSYGVGQVGLRCFRTQARFANLRIEAARPRCFVVMPFAAELDFVFRVIKDTVEGHGIDCQRADEVFLSRPVMADVKDMIASADLVIVDFSGRNPNVYYEAGLADAWGKDWIVLAQSPEDLSFDVRHIRAIRYSNSMGADRLLHEHLCRALAELRYRPLPPAG
ncbi:MAG: hypothetical protein KBC73_06450 [Burkholderiaceae bacterium]|nr:hypothetical protein [Burkholderiaceae bacterium]